jgi:hypothetical protein
MADFTFEIHSFIPEPPIYNVLTTKMEGWKVKRRLKSTAPQRRWHIEIRGRTTSEKNSIVSHFEGQYSNLTPFNWVVNPTSFDSGTYYVTYEDFQFENSKQGVYNVWDFSITFLEEIT